MSNLGKRGEWKLTPEQCETRRINARRWVQEHPKQHREKALLGGLARGRGAEHSLWTGGLVASFLRRFEAVNDGCWLWKGHLTPGGYAVWKAVNMHRFSYELFRAPIPDGLEIDHLCHDSSVCKLKDQCPHRRCVNPWHMAVVTRGENARRAVT